MVLSGKGKFINRPTTSGGKKYDKYFFYIPTELARDSAFPFNTGEVVQIKVDSKAKEIRIIKEKSGEAIHRI